MGLKKYRITLSIAFLCVFAAKMMISGAPVFFSSLDKRLMNNVIMQIEEEHKGDSSKDHLKFHDHKLIFNRIEVVYHPLIYDLIVPNSFIEHARRYVDPYHPLVPTPPPNFS